MMENHAYSEVIGNAAAPYLNQLARQGAVFTHSYAITHPSEPNYLALFSGSTHGVTADSCPVELTAPNLAADLIAAWKDVRRIRRRPARGRLNDLLVWGVRAKARPVDRLPQRSRLGEHAVLQLPGDGLHQAADGVIRHPQPV